jgi:hypothetical protein
MTAPTAARWLAGSVGALLALSSTDAGAQSKERGFSERSPSVETTAAALKSEGDRLMAEKKFVEALSDYDRSYALVPNARLHYNRGRILQFMGRYPEALDFIERFQAEASEELRAKVPGLDGLLIELRSKVAIIVFTCNVAGSRVLVGGKDVGRTPIDKPLRVLAGPTTIEVLADRHVPFQKSLALSGNTTTTVNATLTSRDATAELVVRSPVPGLHVFVDEQAIGVAPAATDLKPGPHPVRAAHAIYGDVETEVVLHAGERRVVLLDPTERAPLASRWWFWAGVSAVIIGAATVTTIIALNAAREPPTGTSASGQARF